MNWFLGTSEFATWLLVVTWTIGFVLSNYMLIGWYRILVFIRRVTRESNPAVSQALVFLWACVFSSLVLPLGALFCPAQRLLALVSTIMCGLCVWTFVRYLFLDKEKYIKRAILGQDFVSQHPLEELDYDDLLALGRRKRMIKMYEEFQEIQIQKQHDAVAEAEIQQRIERENIVMAETIIKRRIDDINSEDFDNS